MDGTERTHCVGTPLQGLLGDRDIIVKLSSYRFRRKVYITKIRLYNFDPLKPHIIGVYGSTHYFSYLKKKTKKHAELKTRIEMRENRADAAEQYGGQRNRQRIDGKLIKEHRCIWY